MFYDLSKRPSPNGVVTFRTSAIQATTPLGLGKKWIAFPRVVPLTGQPWALGGIPLGFGKGEPGDLRDSCVHLSASPAPLPASVKMHWGEEIMLAPGRSQRRVRAPGLQGQGPFIHGQVCCKQTSDWPSNSRTE